MIHARSSMPRTRCSSYVTSTCNYFPCWLTRRMWLIFDLSRPVPYVPSSNQCHPSVNSSLVCFNLLAHHSLLLNFSNIGFQPGGDLSYHSTRFGDAWFELGLSKGTLKPTLSWLFEWIGTKTTSRPYLFKSSDDETQCCEYVKVWRCRCQRSYKRLRNERKNERPLAAELVWQETEQDGAEHYAEVEDHLRGFWKEVLLAHKVPLIDMNNTAWVN